MVATKVLVLCIGAGAAIAVAVTALVVIVGVLIGVLCAAVFLWLAMLFGAHLGHIDHVNPPPEHAYLPRKAHV